MQLSEPRSTRRKSPGHRCGIVCPDHGDAQAPQDGDDPGAGERGRLSELLNNHACSSATRFQRERSTRPVGAGYGNAGDCGSVRAWRRSQRCLSSSSFFGCRGVMNLLECVPCLGVWRDLAHGRHRLDPRVAESIAIRGPTSAASVPLRGSGDSSTNRRRRAVWSTPGPIRDWAAEACRSLSRTWRAYCRVSPANHRAPVSAAVIGSMCRIRMLLPGFSSAGQTT